MIETELNHILQKTFPDGQVIVENQSHLHAGHGGSPETGQSHFHVTVISDQFDKKSRIERHKIINKAVFSLFSIGLHALSLKAFSKKEKISSISIKGDLVMIIIDFTSHSSFKCLQIQATGLFSSTIDHLSFHLRKDRNLRTYILSRLST